MKYAKLNNKFIHINRTIPLHFSCLLFTIFILTSCSAQSNLKNVKLEGQWFIEFSHNDIGIARTIIEFQTDDSIKTFTAHTRKDADKDIIGGWKSFLARTFTKTLKNGSLLRIKDGIFIEKSDTLNFAGILVSPMGNFNVNGEIIDNKLYAILSNNSRGNIGALSGNRNIPKTALDNYAALFEKYTILAHEKIYNREVFKSKEWKTFESDMNEITPKLKDDLEMIFTFFYKAEQLPFSHFSLLKPIENPLVSKDIQEQNLFLREKNKETAYLKISSFSGSSIEVDSIFEIIIAKEYKNLIVDLRNNSGGTIEAGMAFATRVVDTTLLGGVFLTQKWFNNHQNLPNEKELGTIPFFTEANFDLIIQGIHNTEGLRLKIIPHENRFNGNLYILTNGNTASTCEPIVYELKKQKRATIVGEKTAGAMLNGEFFELDKGFKMVIPTADYYSSDGFRIDKNGVKPNIEIKQENALEYVLDGLIK